MRGFTRNMIIYAIEAERWDKITYLGSSSTPIPLEKVRVSYDRTLKRMRELGLIKGGK